METADTTKQQLMYFTYRGVEEQRKKPEKFFQEKDPVYLNSTTGSRNITMRKVQNRHSLVNLSTYPLRNTNKARFGPISSLVNPPACLSRNTNKGGVGAQPPAETLKKIADAFAVTPDFLIYGTSDDKAKTKLTDAELINQFKAIEAMDDEDKNVIKKLINAFITKKQIQKLPH